MKNRLLSVIGFCCSVLFAAAVQAGESVEELLQDMAKIQADPKAHAAAITQGQERGILCFSCHGENGNSKRDYIPNLASQNAAYLFTQFEHFGNGIRKDYVMSKLAKQLKDDERVAIALYFADREVKPREQPKQPTAAGKDLYYSVCFACHGEKGHGSKEYPRIAGQPYQFLETTLLNFLHKNNDRAGSPMIAVVANLKEEQLKEVAAYVSHMP
ncbi:c-type cytochrome [Oceanobacter mangrovi]|uniref:c-type cytochrome n=1 Tax=Oceanobacter mangrovi TaxID=2862510 RepID=UPI001C8DAB33|nr:c-type cytochrome [Oceanobacter mangrovi]